MGLLDTFVAGSVLLLLDQWSKRTVRLRVQGRSVSCGRLFRIGYFTCAKRIHRRRAARTALALLWCVALVSAIFLYRSGNWFQSDVARVGLGFALGGAAANLLDILRLHAVVDFVDFRWWPVFNMADIGIVGGLLMAFGRML